MRRSLLPNPYELLWMALGLLLTVAGTLLQVSLPSDWAFGIGPFQLAGYTFSFQVAGFLLTAFLGGPRAALLSQLAYVSLGLLGYNVFAGGGGAAYVQEPAFGYLLGFIPGAWVCGSLLDCDRRKSRRGDRVTHLHSSPSGQHKPGQPKTGLKELFVAGLMGLVAVHITGISYLLVQSTDRVGALLVQYSGYMWGGQLLVLVAVALAATTLRLVMFL